MAEQKPRDFCSYNRVRGNEKITMSFLIDQFSPASQVTENSIALTEMSLRRMISATSSVDRNSFVSAAISVALSLSPRHRGLAVFRRFRSRVKNPPRPITTIGPSSWRIRGYVRLFCGAENARAEGEKGRATSTGSVRESQLRLPGTWSRTKTIIESLPSSLETLFSGRAVQRIFSYSQVRRNKPDFRKPPPAPKLRRVTHPIELGKFFDRAEFFSSTARAASGERREKRSV